VALAIIYSNYALIAGSNTWRTTSEEKRHEERMINEDPVETYNNIRRAAEVHRQVRSHARKFIRPGMTMTEIANNIEDGTRALVEAEGFESGIGFPTGLSLNHCAAHYTPNAGDTVGKPNSQSSIAPSSPPKQCYSKGMCSRSTSASM
jgi:methionyl aminopeptidase